MSVVRRHLVAPAAAPDGHHLSASVHALRSESPGSKRHCAIAGVLLAIEKEGLVRCYVCGRTAGRDCYVAMVTLCIAMTVPVLIAVAASWVLYEILRAAL